MMPAVYDQGRRCRIAVRYALRSGWSMGGDSLKAWLFSEGKTPSPSLLSIHFHPSSSCLYRLLGVLYSRQLAGAPSILLQGLAAVVINTKEPDLGLL